MVKFGAQHTLRITSGAETLPIVHDNGNIQRAGDKRSQHLHARRISPMPRKQQDDPLFAVAGRRAASSGNTAHRNERPSMTEAQRACRKSIAVQRSR